MPHQPLRINIPEPCGEDWDAMPEVGHALRYCAQCQHTLTDFTGMTDREVHQKLNENNGRICGRFRPDQLGRPILAEPVRVSRWRAWFTAASILLGSGGIAAQLAEPPAYGITAPAQSAAAGAPIDLSGVVTTDDGEPLIGTSIVVSHKGHFYLGTTSGIDGSFFLDNIPANATIKLSYTGYEDLTIDLTEQKVSRENFLDVVMKNRVYACEEIVITAYKTELVKCYLGGAIMQPFRTSEYRRPFSEAPILNYLEQATVYPNPFTDRLFLDFVAEHPGKLSVELTAPDGRFLKRWQNLDFTSGKNHLQFRLRELGSLLPGHYFLQLTDADGRTETRVVIRGSR